MYCWPLITSVIGEYFISQGFHDMSRFYRGVGLRLLASLGCLTLAKCETELSNNLLNGAVTHLFYYPRVAVRNWIKSTYFICIIRKIKNYVSFQSVFFQRNYFKSRVYWYLNENLKKYRCTLFWLSLRSWLGPSRLNYFKCISKKLSIGYYLHSILYHFPRWLIINRLDKMYNNTMYYFGNEIVTPTKRRI